MQIAHNNMIPCILTKGFEFFAVEENVVKAFHNELVLGFDQLPDSAYMTIRSLMQNQNASFSEMQQFVFKRWGGLDNTPDIDERGVPSGPEYLPDFTPACFDSGKEISQAQMRVLKLIYLEDKVIAEKLFMSPYTVARHCQDLYNNSGIKGRSALTVWAKNKGII